jgi:penicillin-binding protein-related factor A (putative recombinase)
MAVIALMREEQGGNPGEWSSPQNVLKRVHAYDATGFVITDPVLHKLLYLIHCSEAQFLVNRAKKAAISRWKRAPKKNIKKPS